MKCSFTAILCLISKNGSEATIVIGFTWIHKHSELLDLAKHCSHISASLPPAVSGSLQASEQPHHTAALHRLVRFAHLLQPACPCQHLQQTCDDWSVLSVQHLSPTFLTCAYLLQQLLLRHLRLQSWLFQLTSPGMTDCGYQFLWHDHWLMKPWTLSVVSLVH